MPDERPPPPGNRCRRRIATGDPIEVREWAMKFAVSEEKLLVAVRNVGDDADDVEAYLQRTT